MYQYSVSNKSGAKQKQEDNVVILAGDIATAISLSINSPSPQPRSSSPKNKIYRCKIDSICNVDARSMSFGDESEARPRLLHVVYCKLSPSIATISGGGGIGLGFFLVTSIHITITSRNPLSAATQQS